MKVSLVLVTILVALGLVTSSASPLTDLIQGRLVKRSPQNVKGSNPPVALRKGEYRCGGGVCKLQPLQVPNWCGGSCQYPVY